jgi:hypothetical protein
MVPPKSNGPALVESEPSVPTPRGVIAKLWPWLMALAILAFLLTRIPRKAILNALEAGPVVWLAVYTFLQALLILLLDAYATSVSLAITGFRQQFSLIFLARGATYILGILNYALGQGALGVYLQRSGVTTIRAAGNMLFLMVVNLGVLLFIASFGFLVGGSPKPVYFDLSFMFFGLWVGLVLYLATIKLQPRFLQRYQLLLPLLEAGLSGHLRAAAGRLPHILVLVLTYWGALRLWGIQVPLSQGVAMVSMVLLIGAVPITPLGLGTTQAALVLLFSPFVPFHNAEIRAATVLAFGLIYYFLGIIAQALLGLWCFQKIRNIK